jgi:hypothetical protein
MRSPKEGIKDLDRIKVQGLRGAMMPGFPIKEDYDTVSQPMGAECAEHISGSP